MVSDMGELMEGAHQQEGPASRLLACLAGKAPPRRGCPSAALATSPPSEPLMAIFSAALPVTERAHGSQSPSLSQLAPSMVTTKTTTATASSPRREAVPETTDTALPVQDLAAPISKPVRFCLSRRNCRQSRDVLEWPSSQSLDPAAQRSISEIIHTADSDEEDEDDGEYYFGLPSEYVEVCALGRGGYGTVL